MKQVQQTKEADILMDEILVKSLRGCYTTYSRKEIGWFKEAMQEYALQELEKEREKAKGLVEALEKAIGTIETECADDEHLAELKTALNNYKNKEAWPTDTRH